jgi:hypothetical protein
MSGYVKPALSPKHAIFPAILCHVRSPVKQALRRCTVVKAQEAHNRYRANHGAANLEWSDECYLSAKKQANACQEKLDLFFFFMLNSFKYGFTMFQCFTVPLFSWNAVTICDLCKSVIYAVLLGTLCNCCLALSFFW